MKIHTDGNRVYQAQLCLRQQPERIYHHSMRHGWPYIYGVPPASSRFDELVDHLDHDGITLGNPPTGKVTRVSQVGAPIPSSREDIRQECDAAKVVCFNFYIAPSDNIFCSIKKSKPKIVCEALDLSAKNEEESFRIIRSLAQLFSQRAEKGLAFGFVADRYAELHQRFHWDDFFLAWKRNPPEWPVVWGCSEDFRKLAKVAPTDLYSREQGPKHTIFWKKPATLDSS